MKNTIHPFYFWKDARIKSAKGIYLTDINNVKFIDLTSSACVVNIGYNNNQIKAKMIKSSNSLIFCPQWLHTNESELLAEKLLSILPKNIDTILRTVTGSESVEVALKLARYHTGKSKFLSIKESYHGHTCGALSIGNSDIIRKPFSPLLTDSGYIQHPALNLKKPKISQVLEEIEQEFKSGLYAAFVTEVFLTNPGFYKFHDDFLPRLKKLCLKYGVLLIIDEVITGFGRTGKMFAIDHYDFEPDIICFAKGLSSGYSPIGAVATNKLIAKDFEYFATFAWSPFACAIALENINILENSKMIIESSILGDYMRKALLDKLSNSDKLKDVRGSGMITAVEITDTDTFNLLLSKLYLKKIILLPADLPNIFLITPPLCISKKEIDKVVKIITSTLLGI
jgi:adenosylmethionine-8-amino-7-oxononanoate aminotransferase